MAGMFIQMSRKKRVLIVSSGKDMKPGSVGLKSLMISMRLNVWSQ